MADAADALRTFFVHIRVVFPLARHVDPKSRRASFTASKAWAAERGYDPVFGARPLRRFLQRNIETKLARALIKGDIQEGSEVRFGVERDELVLVGSAVSAGK